jgi:threonine dehydrogenase-like Zn-dependent dehydrogenase
MGHEGIGIVTQIGNGVQSIGIGGHVVIPDIVRAGELNMQLAEPEASFGTCFGLGSDFADFNGCQCMSIFLQTLRSSRK